MIPTNLIKNPMSIQFDVAQCLYGALGGLLLGLASSLHLYLYGRVTGISGLVFNVLKLQELYWRLPILLGIVFAGAIALYLRNITVVSVLRLSFEGYAIAGFLVGLGAKLANGCTSGHGVCGIPRLSRRSFVAIGLFMALGIAAAEILNRVILTREQERGQYIAKVNPIWTAVAAAGIYILVLFWNLIRRSREDALQSFITFLVGAMFSVGLAISGMTNPDKIISFLNLGPGWNPCLAFVMGAAVLFNFLAFHFILKNESPKLIQNFSVPPPNKAVDWQLLLGSCLFGLGWGLGGLCPGPVLSIAGSLNSKLVGVWMAGFAGGLLCVDLIQYISEKVKGIQVQSKKVQDRVNNVNDGGEANPNALLLLADQGHLNLVPQESSSVGIQPLGAKDSI